MKKVVYILLLAIVIIGGVIVYPKAKIYLAGMESVNIKNKQNFYIKTGATYTEVLNSLKENNIINGIDSFKNYGSQRNLNERTIRAGKYVFKPSDTWKEVVEKLRKGNGEQEVNITFNNTRTVDEIATKITRNVEITKDEFVTLINNPEVQRKYGFNEHTIRTVFIPNTYRVFWDISSDELLARMAKEYKAFWNTDRKAKANSIGLSQSEVSTLASIVYTETPKLDDAAIIAGVYINRIKRGIPLQADPTLIFAIGDFTIKRVLNKDKEIQSPYNTYKNLGLPPGPIYVSPISYIDAVLDYKKHDYLYFCAREDFSGYSNFAKTLSQHNVNARKYQQALNKRKTYR